MKYPVLTEQEVSRQTVDAFGGYNHNLRIGDGEFFDMRNMTSDYYPVLSPRGTRGVYAKPGSASGLIAKDALCYVDGTDFVINGYHISMGLNAEPKQLVSMGAYVIILPDKKWINTANWDDANRTFDETNGFGSIEAVYTSSGDVKYSLCRVDSTEYDYEESDTEPESPENMAYWVDTAATPYTLKQYSASSGVWVDIATTYIKIEATGIGKDFSQYDGVTVSGVTAAGLEELNSSTACWAVGDDYIVVPGILSKTATQTDTITVTRTMPVMDHVIEAENRLWGCRYGVAANGQVVNEIYASKLGDFKNWNCFMGLSTDSYVASCGTDGQFTGAINLLGYPLFFKENCIHKVFGSYPASYQIQTTACRGVQKGCEKSLAIVNATLFYKARSGVCAYDGSLPTEVSAALGNGAYSDAVAGSIGNKYYVSMRGSSGLWELLVYDTAKGMWHKEDELRADCFCACRGELYAIRHDTGEIVTMLGSGTPDTQPVQWMVQTGEIGMSSPDMKYISRITVRMSMEIGTEVSFYAQYDFSDDWEQIGSLVSANLRSFSIPLRPKRCDHMKLRIEGSGPAKIYSVTKTVEQGSELS